MVCAAFLSLGQPVFATESNMEWSPGVADAGLRHSGAYAALVDYARQVGIVDTVPVAAKQPQLAWAGGDKAHSGVYQDPAYSALADFVQQIDAEQPPAGAGLPTEGGLYSALLAREAEGADAQPASEQKVLKVAAAKAAVPVKVPAGGEATIVGSQTCLRCHANHAAAFEKTPMGRYGKVKKGTMECENCHGAGSLHVKAGGGRGVGGIMSFRPNDTSHTAAEYNAICLACHEKGDRTYWKGSTHETRQVACTNCHTVMKQVSRKHNLKTAFEPDTCFQCHKDRRAQMMRSSHMPIREGKVACSDCHNPHGSVTAALLKGDSVNDGCYSCHAEKRGPFLFEHAPVRDNCLNCHDPHGAINDNLLKVSRPRLCAECHGFGHGLTAGPAAVQSMARSCTNCHTQIHGTNSPSGALLHR